MVATPLVALSDSKLRRLRLDKQNKARETKANTMRSFWNKQIFGNRKAFRRALDIRHSCMQLPPRKQKAK